MTNPDRAEAGPNRGADTASALLDAAAAVVAEQGWQNASVRAIAARAGVPIGSIAYHFGGREALLLRATMRELGAMFEVPSRLIQNAPSTRELVTGILTWPSQASVTENQRVILLEVMAEGRRNPAVSHALSEALLGYRIAVSEALTRVGSARPDKAAVSALVAHANGLWIQQLIEPDFPHEAAAHGAISIWVKRLGNNPPSVDA